MLNRVVRVDVTETVTIERRHEGCGGVGFAASRGKGIQGRGHSVRVHFKTLVMVVLFPMEQ